MSIVVDLNFDSSTNLTDPTNFDGSTGDDISITAGAALVGTVNGLNIVVDDTGADYGYIENLTPTSDVYQIRFYFNLNGVTLPSSTNMQIFSLLNNAANVWMIARFEESAGSTYLAVRIYNDEGVGSTVRYSSALDASEHYAEFHVTRETVAGANDGGLTWKVDGVDKTAITGIGNIVYMADLNRVQFGATSSKPAGSSGTYYLDELIINDDGGHIGPLGGSESASASVSPSVSPSASPSVSPSLSPSASVSPSVSPSASPSVSPSVSPSISPSPSTAPPIVGTTVWGHDTDVTETNVRDFTGNWTGTGAISLAGDAEKVCLGAGEYMESEVVQTGGATVSILQNQYAAGDSVTIKYRHGNTEAACLAASWNSYTVPFTSLGYIQVRIEG